MLDQITDLIRNYAGNAVVNNPAIPNEQNENAISQGSNSIIDTLKSALTGGRVNDLLSFFSKGSSGNPDIVNEATYNYSKHLQKEIGLNASDAGDVASKVIPSAMEQLASRTVDPADKSFNIQDIFNRLSGGKTGGLNMQGLLDRFGAGGLDKDRDGDVDFKDLKSLFAGDAASGFMDSVKKFTTEQK